MSNRISLIPRLSSGLIAVSVALCLGCSIGGCGGDSGTKVDTAPQPVPEGIKGMQENLKQQAALQKGAGAKQKRPAPSGK
jgi:hypothetical protein